MPKSRDHPSQGSLTELYKQFPEARKVRVKKNPDGCQEVLWGGGLVERHVMLSGGKVILHRWQVLRKDEETAEDELASLENTFGQPLITTLPDDEPEMVSCTTWIFEGFFLRAGVVRSKLSTGDEACYLETLVVNKSAIAK